MTSCSAGPIRDYAERAQSRLPDAVWQYLHDGDVGRNEQALAQWHVMPRPLADVRGGSARLTLLGQALEHPIVLAPVAYQRLFHPDGETASAAAAAAQGGQTVVSSLASQTFGDVVNAALAMQGLLPWFQLYWQGGRDATARLLDRALGAGMSTVVFTVDAPVKRATLELPACVRAVNLDAGGEAPIPSGGRSEVFDGWMAHAPTWKDVEWLRARLGTRSLVLKGLLHPDDAQRALDFGCDAIVVSNHGHRVLPTAPASANLLGEVVRRIGTRMPILFDGGVRSGADIFVALALGASGVLVGRPPIWGLAVDGALGVARVIRLLRDELELTMALAGCARLADISSANLVRTQSAID